MSLNNYPPIVFSETLSNGIMVHFHEGLSVFFSAAFLYEQRGDAANRVLVGGDADDPQRSDEGHPQHRGAMVEKSPGATGMSEPTLKLGDKKTVLPKILVVDDDEGVRTSLKKGLEFNQFQITTAGNIREALHRIHAAHAVPFDVLLSDIRMTKADESFSLVNAIRHSNPHAVTLVYTGSSELGQALDAFLSPSNDASPKPMALPTLVSLIQEKFDKRGKSETTNIERVAAILERDSSATISDWLLRVEREDELTSVPLSNEQRTGHLPKLLEELVHRLRVPRRMGTKAVSEASVRHGKVRYAQGYSVPMIIEESRILQVSIFETLQNNLTTVNFSLLLIDVMAIADEVDSQLKQTIVSFTRQAVPA